MYLYEVRTLYELKERRRGEVLLLPLDRSCPPCEMKLRFHEEGENRNQIQTQDFNDL